MTAQGIVTDNFDSGTLDPQWQVRNVVQPLGGYVDNSFPANGSGKALRLQRGSADMSVLGYPQQYGTGRAWLFRTNDYTDFYVAMDVVNWNDATNQAIVLLARASGFDETLGPGFPPGLGTTDGYVCNYDNRQDGDTSGDRLGGEFQINLVQDEGPSTLAAAEVTLIQGRDYRMVFKGAGTTLTAQLYDTEDLSTPIVTIVADDPTYSSGKCGIVTFHRHDDIHPNRTDMTVDNYYSGPSDPNMDISPAIRHSLAGTPQVVTRTPVQRFTNFHPAASGISFTVNTFSTNVINAAATKLYLNDVDSSASLAPLPPNGASASFSTASGALAPNTVYSARIEVEDTAGVLKSTNTFWFDTFTDAYLLGGAVKTIETEDYNYAGGQFQLDPIPVSGKDTNGGPVNGGGTGYYGLSGLPDVDYHAADGSADNNFIDYRFDDFGGGDRVRTELGLKDDIQDGVHLAGDPTTRPYDTRRSQYAARSMEEYLVCRTRVGDWRNYTRSFTDTNYNVYLRCGSFGNASIQLDLVGNPTATNQTTTPLGTFSVSSHLWRANMKYVPLLTNGAPAVIHLSGTNTLRLTLLGTAPFQDRLVQENYLLFVPVSQSVGQSSIVFDDFNDGNDTAPPVSWVRYDPIGTGNWSFPGGNTYRIQSAASPDPGSFGQGRAGSVVSPSFSDFYVSADVVAWDDSIHQIFGLLARVATPGPGTTSGYLFSHDRGDPANSTSGDMDIVRLDGEVPTSLTTTGSDSIHFEPGKTYRLAFMGTGGDLRGQVYELPDLSSPVVDITATDDAYASGTSGLVVANNASPTYDGPADATFDNFLATTAEPRITPDFTGGVLRLTWPQIPFRLQSSSSLGTPAWNDITTGITQVGSQTVYNPPLTGGSQFYRLTYP